MVAKFKLNTINMEGITKMFKKTFLIGLVLVGSLALAACGGGGGGGGSKKSESGSSGSSTSRVAFAPETGWGAQSLDISGTTSDGQAYSQTGINLAGTTYVDLPYGQYNVVWHHDTSHQGHYEGDQHHQYNVNAPSHHYDHNNGHH